jgi:hypothetical protein
MADKPHAAKPPTLPPPPPPQPDPRLITYIERGQGQRRDKQR